MTGTISRRGAIGLAAAGTLGVTLGGAALGATPSPDSDLERAFRRAFATAADGGIDVAARMALLADDAVIVSDDVPFPLDRDAYEDHLRFLHANTETSDILFYDLVVRRHGESGTVSAFYNARAKPKGAGFRLRAGFCTAVCASTADGWRAIALHMAPLVGQIRDASPS